MFFLLIKGKVNEERQLMEYLLQVLHFTTSLFHLYLVFSKAKHPPLKTSGQMYTHSHLSISLMWYGKTQEQRKKENNEGFHFVTNGSLKLLINLLDHFACNVQL